MHDIRVIRENPSEFDAVMARRGLAPVSGHILKLDEERRSKILAAETAQAAQNKAAKEIGAAKASGVITLVFPPIGSRSRPFSSFAGAAPSSATINISEIVTAPLA